MTDGLHFTPLGSLPLNHHSMSVVSDTECHLFPHAHQGRPESGCGLEPKFGRRLSENSDRPTKSHWLQLKLPSIPPRPCLFWPSPPRALPVPTLQYLAFNPLAINGRSLSKTSARISILVAQSRPKVLE
jgi:hypothetical protein